MTIKQQGGVFGRHPTFSSADIDGPLTVDTLATSGAATIGGTATIGGALSAPSARFPAGTYPAHADAADLVIGSTSGNNGLTIVSSASGIGSINFGDNGNIDAGQIRYRHGLDMQIVVERQTVSVFTTNGLAFSPGAGIDFSATAGTGTSELFDDYEEGTWTPVLSDASTGGTLATGTFTGTYTKIGRLVTVNSILTDITTAGMTAGNILYIRGLPFAAGTGHMGSNMLRSVTYTGQIAPRTLDGLAYFYLYTYATGGAVTPLTVAAISSGVSDIWLTVTYEA